MNSVFACNTLLTKEKEEKKVENVSSQLLLVASQLAYEAVSALACGSRHMIGLIHNVEERLEGRLGGRHLLRGKAWALGAGGNPSQQAIKRR